MTVELADEASKLRERLGFQAAGWLRTISVYVLVIGIFGVFLPWQKGRDFLDAVILGAYACLGVVFAAPAAAAEFESVPTIRKALARVMASVAYGELAAVLLLMLGMITVYVSHTGPIMVGPNLVSLAECAAFGLTLSLAVSMAASYVSVSVSSGTAKTVVRVIFLGLLAAFYFRSGWLPTVALRGSGIALLVSILLFLVMQRTLATRKQS